MLTARLRRLRALECFRFGPIDAILCSQFGAPASDAHAWFCGPPRSGVPLAESEAVAKLAKATVPRAEVSSASGDAGDAQCLGAAARGPSFAVSAWATTFGTMLRTSPPNRATSLMPDERNTKYF